MFTLLKMGRIALVWNEIFVDVDSLLRTKGKILAEGEMRLKHDGLCYYRRWHRKLDSGEGSGTFLRLSA